MDIANITTNGEIMHVPAPNRVHLDLILPRDRKTKHAVINRGNGCSNTKTPLKELRLFIYDFTTKQKFLLDSDSSVSILPVSSLNKRPAKDNLTLYAANTSTINTYSTKNININLNLRRSFYWTFIIADIQLKIIGADFLTNFNLLIDLKQQRLIDPLTKLSTNGQTLHISIYNISTINSTVPIEYAKLLREYIEITKPISKPKLTNIQFAYRIVTNGILVSARLRKLAGEKAAAARAQISELLEKGIIQLSSSAYANPIHMQRKKDNGWRLCGDYRQLNSYTTPDMYAPPLIRDLFSCLTGTKIFSKLDLKKAYHQIPMHPDDIHKTTITTP